MSQNHYGASKKFRPEMGLAFSYVDLAQYQFGLKAQYKRPVAHFFCLATLAHHLSGPSSFFHGQFHGSYHFCWFYSSRIRTFQFLSWTVSWIRVMHPIIFCWFYSSTGQKQKIHKMTNSQNKWGWNETIADLRSSTTLWKTLYRIKENITSVNLYAHRF